MVSVDGLRDPRPVAFMGDPDLARLHRLFAHIQSALDLADEGGEILLGAKLEDVSLSVQASIDAVKHRLSREQG